MRKGLLSIGIILCLSDIVLASGFFERDIAAAGFNPGVYLGGQAGITNLNYDESDYINLNSGYDDISNPATRWYLGYSFNQHISTELGYNYFGHPKFNSEDGNTQDILQHGVDLVMKATLPINYCFGLYAKGGASWIHRSSLHPCGCHFADKNANSKLVPIGGLGINYWLASNIAIDIGCTKTMPVSDLPTTDFFALGIVYKITL
ncbi:MAG: outer membrane beta-barrel protein [Coxiellaceae bacterium]|nr:outer membrane beta-barrel protein [Coxiellaceae bacterium]